MKNKFYHFVDQAIRKALPPSWAKIPAQDLTSSGSYKIRQAFYSEPKNGQSKLINALVLSIADRPDEYQRYHLQTLTNKILDQDQFLMVITEEAKDKRWFDQVWGFFEDSLSSYCPNFLWLPCSQDEDYQTYLQVDSENLHEVVHDLWKGTLSFRAPAAGLQKVNLELVKDICPDCERPITTVSGIVFPNMQLERWNNSDWQYYNQLAPLADISGENAKSIQQFVKILRKVDPSITPIGKHYSSIESTRHIAATCPYCKALRDNWEVQDYRLRYMHSFEGRLSGDLTYYSISLNIDQATLEALTTGFEGSGHICYYGWTRQ